MGNPTILFVDDEVAWGLYFRAVLDEENVTFRFASSMAEVMKTVQREDCHLIVADSHLPGLNGVELLSRVKQERPHLPVIFLISGYGFDRAAPEELLSGGAREVLTKEDALSDLGKLVRGFLPMTAPAAEHGL